MSEYTSGPWFYSRQRGSVGCAAGWIVGPHWHDRKSDEEFGDQDSDGMLIAAAPEMFELLLDIVADYHAGDMDVQSVAHEAKRLIAKVRGEVTP